MGNPRSRPKLDLVKLHKADYEAPRTPKILRIPPARYLAISGTGRPGGEEFQGKLGALYAVAYTLKFQEKSRGRDFRVPMLEGLYQLGGDPHGFVPGAPMRWRLIVRVHDDIRRSDLNAAVRAMAAKGKEGPFRDVGLATLREGTCVQMLHVGSWAEEEPTVDQMIRFAAAQGRALQGDHHEIYLSDPRRVPTARLRTILRYPVRRAKAVGSPAGSPPR
jgi:hypothetical protein